MKKTVTIKFGIGEEVTLKTEEPLKRIVTGIVLRDKGIVYELACGEVTTWHQSVEIEKLQPKTIIGGFNKKQ